MCRRREKTESQVADPVSPYDKEIDQMFSKVDSFTSGMADITKKMVGLTYDWASSAESSPWNMDEKPESVDKFFNRPYQSRTGEESRFRGPLEFLRNLGDIRGFSPFGIYGGSSPTPRQFNECARKQGQSLWDSDGYWRCLFPNQEVPKRVLAFKQKKLPNEILTKQDFESAALRSSSLVNGGVDLGPAGLFFREYNDYLRWRNGDYERRRQERERRNEEFVRVPKPDAVAANGKPTVVSTTLLSHVTNSGGEVVMKETKTEVFSDGTSVTSNTTRTKPSGATEWTTVAESPSGEPAKGWFWK